MSWNPVHFIEDYYNSLDVSSPISAQVLSCTPGEETANDKDSTNLVKEPVCKPKTLYVEKLFATKDEVFLTEKFPVTSCPAKREKTEKEISDMLRIDGTRRYTDYKFDKNLSIANAKVQEKVIYNKSSVPTLMADSYFKYPRTAGVKIDYEKTDGTILDTSLPMNERYPTIFPKEDDSEVVFESFKMKSSNTTSIDSGLNFAMTWYNSASRSSSSSSNGYNSGSEESSYSSSGYYASSTSSRSPERAPRIKKKCKKATKNLDETDFLSSNAGPEMCNDLELKYGCFN